MRIIIILMLPIMALADAVIFSGNDVKTLKQNIDLFGVAKIMSGTLDPSAGGGVAAPQGSLYLSTVNGTYEKTGAGNTAWTKLALLPVDLTTDVTGVLPIANGGTNNSTAYTAGSVVFSNGTSLTQDNANLFWDDANDRLTVGSTVNSFTINGSSKGSALTVSGQGGGNAYEVGFHKNSATLNPSLFFLRSRGSTASPSIVQNGDLLAEMDFIGYDGTDYEYGAKIDIKVDGTPGNNDMPSSMNFYTVADGTNTPTQRIQINNAGRVSIGSSAPTASAKLDIQGTDGALLIPRMTTVQKEALTAVDGMIIYDTTLLRFQCYIDTFWTSCDKPKETTVSVTASGTIPISSYITNYIANVSGSGGPVTASLTPFGGSGVVGGTVTLIGTNNTNTVTFLNNTNSNGLRLNGDCTLGENDTLTLMFTGTSVWVEVSRSN